MKMLGFLLISLSSALCGLCYISLKKDRVSELEAFSDMLTLMQGELLCRLSPLTELAAKLSENTEGKAGSFLKILALNLEMLGERAFYDIWCESLNVCVSELNKNELEAIKSLGNILGRYDVKTQTKAIDEVIEVLKRSALCEKDQLPQLKRLSMGISASAGAILAILLV